MKKAVILSILGVILLASESNAQRFVTSFGLQQSWGMPYDVYYTLDRHYWGFDIVHASRIIGRGRLHFEVILQRGDMFIRLKLGRNGHVFREHVTYAYPLGGHNCSNICGFHNTFYMRYSRVNRHGRHHVVYNSPSRPVRTTYRGGRHYEGHEHHSNGRAYGNYKKQNENGRSNRGGNGRHHRNAIANDDFGQYNNRRGHDGTGQRASVGNGRVQNERRVSDNKGSYTSSKNYPGRRTD